MIWVLGYPGSGTKWASQIIHAAVGKDWREEPFQHDKANGPLLFGGYRPERHEKAVIALNRFLRGHIDKVSVVKDEFAVPYHFYCLDQEQHKLVYITRDTLANVEFLLRWHGLKAFDWYFRGICINHPEERRLLWPEKEPDDSVVAMLAVAHELQLWDDLRAAEANHIPVFAYETLCADYVTEWPRLFRRLELGMPPHVAEMIQKRAAAPYSPLATNGRIIDCVDEVREKAKCLSAMTV